MLEVLEVLSSGVFVGKLGVFFFWSSFVCGTHNFLATGGHGSTRVIVDSLVAIMMQS